MPYRPTERTEARRRQARERLLDAAHDLVARGGYRAASVSAVAGEAGLATGSVYRHFPSKAELFAEVFRRAAQREVDAVHAAVGGGPSGDRPAIVEAPTPFERLTAGVETFARRALRAPRLAYALLVEPVDPAIERERLVFRRAYAESFAAVLNEGIASSHLPPQNVDLTAAALVGAIGEALVGPLARTDEALSPDELIRSLVDLSLRAAGARIPLGQPA